MLEHTPVDRHQVEEQLGRPLRGRWAVARRCHLGIPMVIENHPRLEDGSPFPTLYWLTCPVLLRRVSTLEAGGAMNILNDELRTDSALHERQAQATTALIERRDLYGALPEVDAPPGGGPDKIKCLHAHVAQELALPPDPAGALTLQATGWPDCRTPCVTDVTG